MDTITATLSYIRYQGDNNFIIGMFDNEEKKDFSCLGNIINPQIGLEYKLHGHWGKHSQFGDQFKFENYETLQPKDEDGIYRYLVRYAKHVGPVIAEDLIDKYGEKTLDVLREDPKKVASEISGLSIYKAKQIQLILQENEEVEAVLVELGKILSIDGLRKNLPIYLLKKYGSDAAEELKANPYILTQFNGTGFLMADKVALSIGFDKESIFRKKAAIEYVIREQLHQGHTWVLLHKVIDETNDLINTDSIDGYNELLDIGEVVKINNNGIVFITLYKIDKDETLIANSILQMLGIKHQQDEKMIVYVQKENITGTETTFIEEANIYQCNNCGAYDESIKTIKHSKSCKKGEAKHWENFYGNEKETKCQTTTGTINTLK